MPEEKSWNRIESVFNKVPVPYPLISLILFIISYLVYLFLSARVKSFDPQDWDIFTRMQIVSTCFLVAYETAGVRYFIDNMREVFRNMEPVPECENDIIDLNSQLEKKFTKSKIFYIIIFLVVIPFILIDLIRGEIYLYSLSEETPTIWSIFLDVFNYTITLLILYSMATILWIIFNTTWALNEIESSHQHIIKIDLFNFDKVGGLKPIRDLILKLVVYQFIAVSLAIITFITPYRIIYYEIIFLIVLFIITVYVFVAGWYVIHKLLEGERGRIINTINELYLQQNQRMQDIISSEEYWDKEEKLGQILKSMKFLQDEIARVMRASKRAYNFKAIFVFTCSSLIPFITTYLLPLIIPEESDGYGQVIQSVKFFNQHVLTLINEFLRIFS